MALTFKEILEELQIWRNEDHEDNITLHRNEVITLIEGIRERLPDIFKKEENK